MALHTVTAPDYSASYPLADDAIAQHVRRDSNADDAAFAVYKLAAVQAVEKFLRRPLLPTVFELLLDCFPYNLEVPVSSSVAPIFNYRLGWRCGIINIPMPTLISVNSVIYVDTNSQTQTMDPSTYQVDVKSKPGRLAPAASTDWPEVAVNTLNAVTIQFTGGWADTASIPPVVKSGLLIVLANIYKNRDTIGIDASKSLTYDLTDFEKSILGPFQNRFTT